jgi:hypothetical protein
MKLPKSSGGDMIVHLIDSPKGQAELASHGLITYDLITAIKHFQVAEGIRVGTLIGVNERVLRREARGLASGSAGRVQ